jgi:hypothetical protein
MPRATSDREAGLSDVSTLGSPEWRHAVFVATALVNNNWLCAETGSHAAVTVMAEELAPFLCAYGAL